VILRERTFDRQVGYAVFPEQGTPCRAALHLSREIANQLRERGINLASLTEGIDTSTTNGRLYFTSLAALGEAERERIQERTIAGLAAARERGRIGGRPTVVTPKNWTSPNAA
jgi:DNA invertase Pin-like site-specific DNA recombinase